MKNYAETVSQDEVARTKRSLEAKGFKVKIAEDKQQAKELVLQMIPKGAEVFTSTSVTLDQLELPQELNGPDYTSLRGKFMELYGQDDKKHDMKRIGSVSEYTVGSVNAITEQGEILITSATGSQIPNYAYGASNLILVVGINKIVKDMNQAMERLEKHIFPLEDVRSQKAYGVPSSITMNLIYRKDPTNRVTVILVNESLGY
ncbi:MAG TPA: lactate utilization protein [Candidatus Saccharimonadales bacterium]|nr:lactate utilization protein [Candidatus Saccharimonadales bacterium]